jgi:GT2 family glycosyltransferase
LNGYDPYYFLTLCDVGDLGIRVRKEGFICYYFPRAEVIHSGGRSNSQVKVLTQIKGIEGELYFLKKNFGNRQYRFAKCVFYLFYKFRYALLLTSYKLFRKKPIYERLKVTNAIINHLKQFKLPI